VIAVAADLKIRIWGVRTGYERLARAVTSLHCAADVIGPCPRGAACRERAGHAESAAFRQQRASKRFHFVSSLAARYSTCVQYPIAEDGIAPDRRHPSRLRPASGCQSRPAATAA
jgi:hypothetical protein